MPLTLLFFFVVFAFRVSGLDRAAVTSWAAVARPRPCYTARVHLRGVRSGINTVPVGQAEAARAIGLTFEQTLRLIVLPQAFRSVVPPMVSDADRAVEELHHRAGRSGHTSARATQNTSPRRVQHRWSGSLWRGSRASCTLIISRTLHRLGEALGRAPMSNRRPRTDVPGPNRGHATASTGWPETPRRSRLAHRRG